MSRSNRDQAMDLYSELSETLSAESILDFLILNYLTGSDALEAMQAVKVEFYGEDEDEEENEEEEGEEEDPQLIKGLWRDSEDFFDEEEEDYNSGLLYGVDNNQ
jgi:hypothetical protein